MLGPRRPVIFRNQQATSDTIPAERRPGSLSLMRNREKNHAQALSCCGTSGWTFGVRCSASLWICTRAGVWVRLRACVLRGADGWRWDRGWWLGVLLAGQVIGWEEGLSRDDRTASRYERTRAVVARINNPALSDSGYFPPSCATSQITSKTLELQTR